MIFINKMLQRREEISNVSKMSRAVTLNCNVRKVKSPGKNSGTHLPGIRGQPDLKIL